MLTALVGTTIAPWQFFYMQAGFVEKHVGAKQYSTRGWTYSRQHHLHGDRFLHHHLLVRHAE